MRRLSSSFLLRCLAAFAVAAGSSLTQAGECPPLMRHVFPGLQDGRPVDLCQYRGKVLLVVNTASRCGYTSQYEGLETLYQRWGERGLVVLGFPSDDFGGQEPGSNREVADFCRTTYGIRFPMLAKSKVAGRDANTFYAALAERAGTAPQWNFHKYLIDRNGGRVLSFASDVRPDDPQLLARIDAWLKQDAAPRRR